MLKHVTVLSRWWKPQLFSKLSERTNVARRSSEVLLQGRRALFVSRPSTIISPQERYFASDKTTGESNKSGSSKPEDDPFGVNYDDGEEVGKLGPSSDLPPEYKRDAATGKFTGDVVVKLTEEERKILHADPIEGEKILLKRIVQSWTDTTQGGTGDGKRSESLMEFARRVRFTNIGLNVFGRSVQAQQSKGMLDTGEELADDETGFSQFLTPHEFESLKKYMEKEHEVEISDDDIPVQPLSSSPSSSSSRAGAGSPHGIHGQVSKMGNIIHQRNAGHSSDVPNEDVDNPDLSTKWMTKRAQWELSRTGYDGSAGDDDPFADMLPGELRPTRLVNRKRAKLLPVELLHHNNLSLLRRYITPTGQIMNRVHSRLGAKDQRRVAKLIKRARNLGLIPCQGQFVVEDHGNIYEKDIHENKWWEKELERRGLVIHDTRGTNTVRKHITDVKWVEEELARRGVVMNRDGSQEEDTSKK